ncbi:PucR family transcriptional regulator [Streptomyces malaysiensis]|uniref:PucR family transcriptional regulator n=1 Tax=Streptomyces malaysiensis TaxID=92644 RepID=UPI0020436D76|nr:PucR family transcriptional regulator [Streptomyces sp. DR7-3]MCM3812938.1 PucR family transcriptional regulator ligand-binding domain-containing protein [Streptomyces sp. DR7-3]
MSITVGELLGMPHLRLRLHSGTGALDRPITWTHTTDLPEPWRWVAGGELLMTNGMPVPRSASGQEELVRQLAEHGAAALAVAEQMYAPPLTKRLTRTSEELGFPVLWIAHPMPFVAISRAVAEATLLEQSQRLIRTERIYQALQQISSHGSGLTMLTSALSRELGCDVRVCDRATGYDWYPSSAPLPEDIRVAVTERRGKLRAGVIAVPLRQDRRALLVDVPTHPDAVLVALSEPTGQPDALLLQHAATVCALALSQARLTIEHDRRTGAELLLQILDAQLAPAAARRQLAELGLPVEEAVCVAARNDDPDLLKGVHLSLWRSAVRHATAHRGGTSLTVLPDAAVPALVQALGPGGQAGVSDLIVRADRVVDAVREATWALDTARDQGTPLLRYADADPLLGPRNPTEAQALVDRVLGPVLQLPSAQSGELLATLRAFLENGRSWQRTAETLHIHRQTVLYRVRRIEQLTGRQVADTGDLAALWLALKAV